MKLEEIEGIAQLLRCNTSTAVRAGRRPQVLHRPPFMRVKMGAVRQSTRGIR